MAHINYTRNVQVIGSRTLNQIISPTQSFACFAGTQNQRNQLTLQHLQETYGTRGIILIHNNPTLEASLFTLDFNHQIIVPNQTIARKESYAYDPLYGMTSPYVLDAIVPMPDHTSPNSIQIASIRTALSHYLDILEFQFNQSSNGFGQYPFNLDLLLTLTSFSIQELDTQVLQYLPGTMRTRIYAKLSQDTIQQQVYDKVYNFAKSMERCIWTPRNSHTCISIIQAVTNRQFISIYVPGNHTDILDYLALECKLLNDHQFPYMLIVDNIDVTQSIEMKNLFLNEHQSLPYTTGFISPDLSNLFKTQQDYDILSLYSQTSNIYVFQCSSTNQAMPFCNSAGNYYRFVEDYHTGYTRQPFHIFSAHSGGGGIHENQELSIHPNELIQNANVCLLCGNNHPIPTLIQNLRFPNQLQTRR